MALVVQAIGSGLAARAHRHGKDMSLGIDTMIAGLGLQALTMFVFSVLVGLFAHRVWHDHRKRVLMGQPRNPNILLAARTPRLKCFLWSLGLATLLILGRSCYRIAELS